MNPSQTAGEELSGPRSSAARVSSSESVERATSASNDARAELGATLIGWRAIAVLIAALVVCRLIAFESFPIYDDAFITYRYARNFAAGLGMVYNPGAPWEPVLGTTTPLYALVLALWMKLGWDVIHASVIFNILCEVVSALCIVNLLGRRVIATTVTIGAFAAIPVIGRITVGGMEPPFLVMLALGSILCAHARRPSWSGVLAAACCLVRPESLFFVAAMAWTQRKDRRALVRFVVPIVVIGTFAATILTLVYGKPIPQSVIAKASHASLMSRLSRVGDILSDAFGPILPMRVFVPIAAIGYVRGLCGGSRMRSLFAMSLAMVASYILVGTKTWGWYFYVPLVVWVIALGLGAESIVERLALLRVLNRDSRAIRMMAPMFAVVSIALMIYAKEKHPDPITPRVYQQLEIFSKTAHLADRKVNVLASDIGAIGFYSNARILDSEGLVWPEALQYHHQVDLVRAFNPEYVIWVVKKDRLGQFLADAELSSRYRPIRRFNENNDRELFPTQYPTTWEQDYLIFERKDLRNSSGELKPTTTADASSSKTH